MGGWADGGDADPGPDQGECQGESEDPEAGSQEVTQPHTLQGQSTELSHSYISLSILLHIDGQMISLVQLCHSYSEYVDM